MPTDPTAFTSAGPFGFIALAALALWWAAREYRKGRDADVDEARAAALEEKQRADAATARADGLYEDLQEERARRFAGAEKAAREKEQLRIEKNRYRRWLIDLGHNPDEVTH